MLHTINQSPYRTNTLETVVRFVQPGDAVLFIEDGVLALGAGGKFKDLVEKLAKTNAVYGLGPDLKARGVENLHDGVKQVDYEGFVDLAVEHEMNAWL